MMFILFIGSVANGDNEYQKRNLRCSMAGRGDPWSALTKERLAILMAMHDGLEIKDLADVFGMSTQQVLTQIKPLCDSHLVKEQNGRYRPDFFIANLSETKKVYKHSKRIGKKLADALATQWARVKLAYSELSLSKNYSIEDMGFILVGSRILDMNVLQALVNDRRLLTVAPARPSPTRPDGQYYFWMLECEPKHLGKYGQEDTDLRWPNWHLLNFGQTLIGKGVNRARQEFEKRSAKLTKSHRLKNPRMLAQALNIPFMHKKDSRLWEKFSREISGHLLPVLNENGADIQAFYKTLKASQHTNNAFGEFFCWYYHLVYVWAIDDLLKRGLISIPADKHSGLVMYLEGPQGLVSN